MVIIVSNTFIYSNTNKRYHTYSYYLKQKYNSKVFKVSLNGGFTCPNRDGSKSIEGCIFCSDEGSGEFAGNINDSLLVQFDNQTKIMHKKWPIAKYIAYFQAYTNTYAPLDYLKECFEPFVKKENTVGISIATRPDCLSLATLDYLEDLNKRINLYVELGLQTIHDKTGVFINRQYTTNDFINAVNQLHKRNIKVVAHIINGLPYENRQMMIDTAKFLATLPLHGIKIHQLNIIKNTKLASLYKDGLITTLSLDDYVDIVIEQLGCLPKEFVIHRIGADARKEDLVAPLWSSRKNNIGNAIDKKMAKDNRYQGDKHE